MEIYYENLNLLKLHSYTRYLDRTKIMSKINIMLTACVRFYLKIKPRIKIAAIVFDYDYLMTI